MQSLRLLSAFLAFRLFFATRCTFGASGPFAGPFAGLFPRTFQLGRVRAVVLNDPAAGLDVLDGAAGLDALDGAAGADEMDGAAGLDVLDGAAGPDEMDGAAGLDVLGVAAVAVAWTRAVHFVRHVEPSIRRDGNDRTPNISGRASKTSAMPLRSAASMEGG